MQYSDFLGQVQQRVRLADQAAALQTVRAALETLAERLTGLQAQHVAAELPRELRHFLERDETHAAEAFGVDEFVERVRARADTDLEQAEARARAVLTVLEGIASRGGQTHGVRALLPADYAPLF
jgi:uncharacterized protein (DUF2267 family)